MGADGIGTHAIMAQTGTAKTTVWRWRTRFMEEGVKGLLRDKMRPWSP
ncbi:helix-turn-helix domain-containing protein [Roseixanthobacter psychrophilus]